MKKKWKDYQIFLDKEIGEKASDSFVKSLYNQSAGREEIAAKFFYELGKKWGPSINNWAAWVSNRATSNKIALILRDAKPLEVIPATKNWIRLYLNRENVGVSDELSGDNTEMHPLLMKYLEQNNCCNHFTFVDSGCYGTIILELHKLGIELQPLFFFSKNPAIPGFLNELGVNEKNGTILNDSLECAFPNIFKRPDSFIEKKGVVEVCLSKADDLSFNFGQSALKGVEDSYLYSVMSPEKEVNKLLLLSDKAKQGFFTGILPEESPEWSQKNSFLTSWPKELNWM
jgi:hypothetical protein